MTSDKENPISPAKDCAEENGTDARGGENCDGLSVHGAE